MKIPWEQVSFLSYFYLVSWLYLQHLEQCYIPPAIYEGSSFSISSLILVYFCECSHSCVFDLIVVFIWISLMTNGNLLIYLKNPVGILIGIVFNWSIDQLEESWHLNYIAFQFLDIVCLLSHQCFIVFTIQNLHMFC